ncbi:agmatinase family protein [Halobaculum sp. MBLA0147]|uniref:agmatinase family protein n=1 Tax=Halobaculum sp. MBLA0147 TaxID=3079934 RepID=UPI003524BE4E
MTGDASRFDPGVELPYAGVETFLDAPLRDFYDRASTGDTDRTEDGLDAFDAAVTGIPYDGAVSNRPGARYGPRAIRRASGWIAYLSGYKGGVTNIRTREQVDFADLSLVDCGDVPVFPMDHDRTGESIAAHVGALAAETFPVVLGGDHSCTAPSFHGFAEGAGHDTVGLVQIDAHSDTSTESPIFGESFHGSSTAEVATGPYSDYSHVSQVGIRGYEAPEFFEFADDTGLNVHPITEVEDRGITSVVEEAISEAAAETDAVYVTFDVDAVDPSVAPGTGTPEPGGLDAHQALATMELLGAHDAVGAVDLMEVAPTSDPTSGTANLAAALLVTLLERQFATTDV